MSKTHNRFIYHCLSCGAICCREPNEPVPVCCRKPMERAAAETVHDCDVPLPATSPATVPAADLASPSLLSQPASPAVVPTALPAPVPAVVPSSGGSVTPVSQPSEPQRS